MDSGGGAGCERSPRPCLAGPRGRAGAGEGGIVGRVEADEGEGAGAGEGAVAAEGGEVGGGEAVGVAGGGGVDAGEAFLDVDVEGGGDVGFVAEEAGVDQAFQTVGDGDAPVGTAESASWRRRRRAAGSTGSHVRGAGTGAVLIAKPTPA